MILKLKPEKKKLPAAIRNNRKPLILKSNAAQMVPFILIIAVFIIVALFPGWFANHAPNITDLTQRLMPPGYRSADGSLNLLGTDELGRDVFTRLLYGTRVSLSVSVAAVLISGITGGLLGILAGYYRNKLGTVIMRFADIVLSIPFFLLAILTVAVLGPSLLNMIIVLGIARWPRYVRVAQGKTLTTVNQDFVKAAEVMGAGTGRILIRHILPEIVPSLVVVATIEMGLMIIFEASLSFIGLGVQPPDPSWGSMLTSGQQYVSQAWWLATFPGCAIFLVVIAINQIGDLIRDALDPKVQ